MLIISSEQIAVFDDQLLATSVREMEAYLRERYAQLSGITKPDLEAMIRTVIRHAESYGIDNVTDVRRFLETFIVLKDPADSSELRGWVRDILAQPELSGTRKMDLIEERITFECAHRARS